MRHRFARPLFGPFRRRAHTGVPADHFRPAREMYGDGVHALIAEGPAPGDDQDDDPRLAAQALDAVIDSAEVAMAAEEYAQAADLIAGCDVIVDHLIELLGGVDADEPDEAAAMAAREQLGDAYDPVAGTVERFLAVRAEIEGLALHAPYTGVHSHAHSHKGVEHTHAHFHNGNSSHRHSHDAAVLAEAERLHALTAEPPVTEPAPEPELAVRSLSRLSEVERRKIDGANEVTDPTRLAAMVASAFDARGGLEAWTALRDRKGLTAAIAEDGTIMPAEWHAYLCAEGIRTDDGREIMPGACRWNDLPVSLRLLVEDEGGHWGAVTCGRIDEMDRRPLGELQMIYGEGLFGSDPNGQLAELMVEEQTQRFVSIDPRDGVAQVIEMYISTDGGEGYYDCWTRYVDLLVGAATIVAMPAMQQAVIALRSMTLPDTPLAIESAPPSLPADLDPSQAEAQAAVAASGALNPRPRVEWFDDPGFHVGDARLVLQADNRSHACPFTIDDPDPETGLRRLYGHVAWWNCDHTGLPGQRQKPPRSPSGYRAYNLGPAVECVDGKVTGIGKVTMGCGHAPLTKQRGTLQVALSAQEAVAHYDGGYGAKTAAWVRAGEDDFGPWVAGYVNPELTDAELREFMALSLSGDWRDIAGELDMVAVLAVPVPGFPVRRAVAASGAPVECDYDCRAGYVGDRLYALVAAGHVQRRSPEERIAQLETLVSTLTDVVADFGARQHAMAVERARERAGL